LEQVKAEYDIQNSGITADDSKVDMGKGENPEFVLSVTARHLGSQNMFIASIINLESGVQSTGGSENYESLNDGMETMERLAQTLTEVSTKSPGELDRIRAEAAKAAAQAEAAKEATAKAVAQAEAAKAAAQAEAAKAKLGRRSGDVVFGYGALNLALGLGSFIQGDIGGGFFTLLSYGVAAGLITWELSLGDYDHELAGIPGTMGIGVAGFAIVYGFIRPAVVNNNRPLAEIIDNVRIGVAPRKDGREALRLTYTVKF
jgi:hypothetical protein